MSSTRRTQRRGTKAHRFGGVTEISVLGRRSEDEREVQDASLGEDPEGTAQTNVLITSIGTNRGLYQTRCKRRKRNVVRGHIPSLRTRHCYQTETDDTAWPGFTTEVDLGHTACTTTTGCQGASDDGTGTIILVYGPTQGTRQRDGVRKRRMKGRP
jgi:hypothetical protein